MPEWLRKLLGVAADSLSPGEVPADATRMRSTAPELAAPIRTPRSDEIGPQRATSDVTATPTARQRLSEALSVRPTREMRAAQLTTVTPAVERAVGREEAAERAGVGPLYRAYRHFQSDISPYLSLGATALPGIRELRGNMPEDVEVMEEAGIYPQSQDVIPAALAEAVSILAPFLGVGAARAGRAGGTALKSLMRPPVTGRARREATMMPARLKELLKQSPPGTRAKMEMPSRTAAELPRGAPQVLPEGAAMPPRDESSGWINMALDLTKMLERPAGGAVPDKSYQLIADLLKKAGR